MGVGLVTFLMFELVEEDGTLEIALNFVVKVKREHFGCVRQLDYVEGRICFLNYDGQFVVC